jgi:hypothetical protein
MWPRIETMRQLFTGPGAVRILATKADSMDEKKAASIAEAVKKECIEVLTNAYEQAGLSGLCGEGRWEYALAALTALDVKAVLLQS